MTIAPQPEIPQGSADTGTTIHDWGDLGLSREVSPTQGVEISVSAAEVPVQVPSSEQVVAPNLEVGPIPIETSPEPTINVPVQVHQPTPDPQHVDIAGLVGNTPSESDLHRLAASMAQPSALVAPTTEQPPAPTS